MMWERVSSLSPTVKEAWETSGGSQSLSVLANKPSKVQESLVVWSRKDFGSVNSSMKKKCTKLEKLMGKPRTYTIVGRIEKASSELDEPLFHEELMWRQCMRATCLRENDQNTKYFHRKAT